MISANDIWAVGSGVIGDESATATLHWSGTAWSIIPSPNVGPEVDNSLAGVAAVSSNDVWAVGTQQPTSLTDPSTLILHWNGVAWTIVSSVSPEGSHLQSAVAIASNDVWATGYSEAGTLAEHWNGSSWSVVRPRAAEDWTQCSCPASWLFPATTSGVSARHCSRATCHALSLSNGMVRVGSWCRVRTWAQIMTNYLGWDATPGGTLWAVGTVYHYPQQRTLIERKLP